MSEKHFSGVEETNWIEGRSSLLNAIDGLRGLVLHESLQFVPSSEALSCIRESDQFAALIGMVGLNYGFDLNDERLEGMEDRLTDRHLEIMQALLENDHNRKAVARLLGIKTKNNQQSDGYNI